MATVQLCLGPADHGRAMTLKEFRDADERSGYLYELARGVREVSEVSGDAHWQIVDNLHEMFSQYRRLNPGLILRIGHVSDVRIVIPGFDSGRHPDLALVFPDAAVEERGRLRAGLVVEIVSPGGEARRRDYETKPEEYLVASFAEYWIVDPARQVVIVLTNRHDEGGAAWTERAFDGGDTIASGCLPGFAGTVDSLWADEPTGE